MVKMTKKGKKRPFFGHFFALFPKIFVKKPKSWSEVGRIIKLHSLADTLAMPTTREAWGGAGRSKIHFFSFWSNRALFWPKMGYYEVHFATIWLQNVTKIAEKSKFRRKITRMIRKCGVHV